MKFIHAPIITRHEVIIHTLKLCQITTFSPYKILFLTFCDQNIENNARLTIRNKYLTSTKWQKLYFINNHRQTIPEKHMCVCVCMYNRITTFHKHRRYLLYHLNV